MHKLGDFLHSAFIPEGVADSYYVCMRWRIAQRFVNANVHVIGTQSLLMGLRGMQRAGGANWVLKDTLGKDARMVWASRIGCKFDPDAKRWRFRASLLYALGNGLEVCTQLAAAWRTLGTSLRRVRRRSRWWICSASRAGSFCRVSPLPSPLPSRLPPAQCHRP